MAKGSSVPAVQSEEKLPAISSTEDLSDLFVKDAGRGYSHEREDSVVPHIKILQDLSPQVKSRDPQYVEGAQAGDFFIPATGKLIKGSEGMWLIPCGFHHEYVEWRPRGQGGIADRHPVGTMPGDVVEREIDGRRQLVRNNGNTLIETRYHFVLFEGQGLVFPFTSTGHQVSKRWTFMMTGKRAGDGVTRLPSFAFKYLVKSVLKSRGDQQWYLPDPQDPGKVPNVTRDEYMIARALANAIESGAKVAETEEPIQDEIPF